MEIYLSENVIRKLIRQELYEVLEDKGIKTKKDDEKKVAITNSKIQNLKNMAKKLAIGGLTIGAITAAIGIGREAAEAEEKRIEQIENEKMMMLSDKIDQKIEQLTKLGVTQETAQKLVMGVIMGIDKTQKDQDKIFEDKINALDQFDDIQTVTLMLSDKFITDMRGEGNQAITTLATGQGAFGVLPTNVDQSIAGMAVEVQKSLENLNVQTGIMYVDTDVGSQQKLRTITFDPLELKYWNDKIEDGSQIEKNLQDLYGDLTIPAFMYETVLPTVLNQQIAGELKENKKTRGKYV